MYNTYCAQDSLDYFIKEYKRRQNISLLESLLKGKIYMIHFELTKNVMM